MTELAGGLTAGLGLIVMLGWFLRSKALVQTPAGFAPMYFNAALCFFLLGLGLIASVRNRPGVSVAAAGLSGLIVLLTLLQSVFSVDLKIDWLFVEPFAAAPGTRFPGRMHNDGALTFLFASIGLILFNLRKGRSMLAMILSVWPLLIGVVALLVYALAYLMNEMEASRLAVHSAAAFVIVGAGLISRGLQPGQEPQSADRGMRLRILLGYATALLLLCFVAIASQLAVQRSLETERMVTQTLQVRAGIEQLFSYVKDIQRGQRGYVITGDESRLEPYHAGRLSVEAKVRELRALILDAAQLQRLDVIGSLIQKQTQIQDQLVTVRREQGLPAAIAQAQLGEGERVMAELHQQVLTIQQAQDELLSKRAELSQRVALLTGRINLAGVLLAVAVLVVGVIVAFRGLGVREKAGEEIRELNRDLEQRGASLAIVIRQLTEANRELEAFTYSVSHDLRAPLRHIDGFSKILMDEFSSLLPPDAQRYLTRVREGTQQMGRLVDDLLNLARVGRQEISLRVTGLNSVVTQVCSELKREEEGREVEWRVGSLPFVECDPSLIKQVFVNLLSNALKYTRPRARAVIEVNQIKENGRPVIFVRDNGVGFNMKYAEKLFGVFQRLHRPEDFEGTGVGLATVQRIVHKHGGKVWAEAELDKGATFYFSVTADGETPVTSKP